MLDDPHIMAEVGKGDILVSVNGIPVGTMNFLINWSISELNTQVNPTTYLGDTDCWIQQFTTPTLVVTCWIQQSVSPKQVVGFTCVFNSEVDQLIRKFIIHISHRAVQAVRHDASLTCDEDGWILTSGPNS